MRLLASLSLLTAVLACPHHNLNFRAPDGSVTAYADPGGDWTYDDAFDWVRIKPAYGQCGVGVTQSPINLSGEFSSVYVPTFDYSSLVSGNISNWGFGLSVTLDNVNGVDVTGNPSLMFDDEELYLRGFHTHSPSEHTIDGVPTRLEVHLVHVDAQGVPQGVVGILIDANVTATSKIPPNTSYSPWLGQFWYVVPRPGSKDRDLHRKDFNMSGLLEEVGGFEDYWTYRGSLTTPPCTQDGLRWWVSGKVLVGSDLDISYLRWVSKFSARPIQPIWRHAVGSSIGPEPVQPTWVAGMQRAEQDASSDDAMNFLGQLEL